MRARQNDTHYLHSFEQSIIINTSGGDGDAVRTEQAIVVRPYKVRPPTPRAESSGGSFILSLLHTPHLVPLPLRWTCGLAPPRLLLETSKYCSSPSFSLYVGMRGDDTPVVKNR